MNRPDPPGTADHDCTTEWPKSRPLTELSPNEVHLWLASLNVAVDEAKYYESLLDERENARVKRYRTLKSKTRFINARGMLKQLLARYCEVNAREIRFRLGELGKPYLPHSMHSPIEFNATDTQDHVLFAVGRGGEVGLDIELLDRKVRHQQIALRKFTSEEYQAYLRKPPAERKTFFLSLWTRKEAYGKARGVGILYKLNSVTLASDDALERFSVRDGDDRLWQLRQVSPFEGATACVVTEGEDWTVQGFRLIQPV